LRTWPGPARVKGQASEVGPAWPDPGSTRPGPLPQTTTTTTMKTTITTTSVVTTIIIDCDHRDHTTITTATITNTSLTIPQQQPNPIVGQQRDKRGGDGCAGEGEDASKCGRTRYAHYFFFTNIFINLLTGTTRCDEGERPSRRSCNSMGTSSLSSRRRPCQDGFSPS
jgi:hypothetical protein